MDQSTLPWWPLPRRARRIGAFLTLSIAFVLAALIATAWKVGSQPASGTGELAAQLQGMTAAIQTFLAFGLGLTTVFYAIQTWAMVNEMRLARLDDAAARRDAENARGEHQMQSAILALTTAAEGALTGAAMLASYISLTRRPWQRRHLPPLWTVLDPIHQRLLEASAAVDQIRSLDDQVRLDLALEIYDLVSDVYAAARERASGPDMEDFGRRLFVLKQALRAGNLEDEVYARAAVPNAAISR